MWLVSQKSSSLQGEMILQRMALRKVFIQFSNLHDFARSTFLCFGKLKLQE